MNSSLHSVARPDFTGLTSGLVNTVAQHTEQHLIDGTLLQSMDLGYEVRVQATKKNKVAITKTVLNSLYNY
jgi:hypothetical protein